MNALWAYITQNSNTIIVLGVQQLRMAFLAVALGLVIGLPVGIYIVRHPKVEPPILWAANAFQTMPQFALLGLFLVFFGLGEATAIAVLLVYMLMPIIRSTYVGISGIDPSIIEVGKGVGMTPNQMLLKIQLPLALPIILTGLRLSLVIAVGGATMMSLVGAGGLGQLIFNGMENLNNAQILVGGLFVALETAALGVMTDLMTMIFTSPGLQV